MIMNIFNEITKIQNIHYIINLNCDHVMIKNIYY